MKLENNPIALILGASKEQFLHLKECLADWECLHTLLRERQTLINSVPGKTKLVVLYARKDEKLTTAIRDSIHDLRSGLPLLLVTGWDDISLGIAFKQKGNATFIVSPFDQEELQKKIEELFEGS